MSGNSENRTFSLLNFISQAQLDKKNYHHTHGKDTTVKKIHEDPISVNVEQETHQEMR